MVNDLSSFIFAQCSKGIRLTCNPAHIITWAVENKINNKLFHLSEAITFDELESVTLAFQAIGTTLAIMALVGIGLYGAYQIYMVSKK